MRDLVTTPLLTKGAEGVSEAIDAMVEYNLIRDDLEKLSELSTWGSATSAWQRVDGKVKAQLTRQYNKMPIMTPFAIQSISGGAKRGQVSTVADYEDGDEDDETFVESEVEEEDADKDSMIKVTNVCNFYCSFNRFAVVYKVNLLSNNFVNLTFLFQAKKVTVPKASKGESSKAKGKAPASKKGKK
jgi:Replication factor RFC1 C terminal domain